MIEYVVRVYENGDKKWFLNGELHREDGPAVEYADTELGRYFYLNDELLTENEWRVRTRRQPSCDGKVVEIDGKKYKLTEV